MNITVGLQLAVCNRIFFEIVPIKIHNIAKITAIHPLIYLKPKHIGMNKFQYDTFIHSVDDLVKSGIMLDEFYLIRYIKDKTGVNEMEACEIYEHWLRNNPEQVKKVHEGDTMLDAEYKIFLKLVRSEILGHPWKINCPDTIMFLAMSWVVTGMKNVDEHLARWKKEYPDQVEQAKALLSKPYESSIPMPIF